MNLFADLLASSQPSRKRTAGAGSGVASSGDGPRIQAGRRGVEIKSAREIAIMRQASRIVATEKLTMLDAFLPPTSSNIAERPDSEIIARAIGPL